MISPQSLAVAAMAVGMQGKESTIFRAVVLWSLDMVLVQRTLVYLQAHALSWMLP